MTAQMVKTVQTKTMVMTDAMEKMGKTALSNYRADAVDGAE